MRLPVPLQKQHGLPGHVRGVYGGSMMRLVVCLQKPHELPRDVT